MRQFIYKRLTFLSSCYSISDQYEKARQALELALECLNERNNDLPFNESLAEEKQLKFLYRRLTDICDILGDSACAESYYKEYEKQKKADEELWESFSFDTVE